jgi:hypothetical protein
MLKSIQTSLLILALAGSGEVAAQSSNTQAKANNMELDVTGLKQALLGDWESIAPEVRPSAAKNADGTLKPFYLKRAFKYLPSDRFELEIVNSADPYSAVPLARIRIGGHMLWRGAHPIAPGAQKVDFVADETYEVTPLAQGTSRRGRICTVGRRRASEHLRQDLRSLRSRRGHELHGI